MQYRCVCGYCMGQCPSCELKGRPMPLGSSEIPPQFGGYQPLGPAELMARHQRVVQAIAQQEGPNIEEAIRAYARKLIAQRAAIVKSERITRTVHEMIKAAGGEPS